MTLKTDKRTQIRDVKAGGSYLSQNDLRLHFGLASAEKIVSAEVRWSDGTIEKIAGVGADQIVTITKLKGVARTSDLSLLRMIRK